MSGEPKPDRSVCLYPSRNRRNSVVEKLMYGPMAHSCPAIDGSSVQS